MAENSTINSVKQPNGSLKSVRTEIRVVVPKTDSRAHKKNTNKNQRNSLRNYNNDIVLRIVHQTISVLTNRICLIYVG